MIESRDHEDAENPLDTSLCSQQVSLQCNAPPFPANFSFGYDGRTILCPRRDTSKYLSFGEFRRIFTAQRVVHIIVTPLSRLLRTPRTKPRICLESGGPW